MASTSTSTSTSTTGEQQEGDEPFAVTPDRGFLPVRYATLLAFTFSYLPASTQYDTCPSHS